MHPETLSTSSGELVNKLSFCSATSEPLAKNLCRQLALTLVPNVAAATGMVSSQLGVQCNLQAIPGMKYDSNSGYWTVTGGCRNVPSLPSVTFQIGGTDYAVPPQIWTRPVHKLLPFMKRFCNATLAPDHVHPRKCTVWTLQDVHQAHA